MFDQPDYAIPHTITRGEAGKVFLFNTPIIFYLTFLVAPTAGSSEILHSSVSTATACKQYGLLVMGTIKTANKQYPKAKLK